MLYYILCTRFYFVTHSKHSNIVIFNVKTVILMTANLISFHEIHSSDLYIQHMCAVYFVTLVVSLIHTKAALTDRVNNLTLPGVRFFVRADNGRECLHIAHLGGGKKRDGPLV